jgi:platelet-activating factor acetylhydrolase IB subunit beta/gamma
VVIVMIGNNNMFFAPETGADAAAKGVQLVVANVWEKFPLAEVVAAKILPCRAPGNLFYENIKKTNGAPAASAAHGIKPCIENLRFRCPQSRILLVKILPAFNPGADVGARVREINDSLDTLQVDADANVRVLDLWREFTRADGSLKTELYADKHLHLGPDGYESFATALKPAVEALLGKTNP